MAPPGPEAAECDPKESIKACQNGSFLFSLNCGELQPESGIFERDGLMAAHQESSKSKDRQENGGHVVLIVHLHSIPSQAVTSGWNYGEGQYSRTGMPSNSSSLREN